MSKRKNNESRSVLLAVIVGLMTMFAGAGVRAYEGLQTRAPDGSRLTASEARGKLIYLKGDDGTGQEIKAVMGDSELELPAKAFPCANCHGLNGEGTSEGGLQPPSITWSALTSPHKSALTGRERVPYDDASVGRAILANTDPSGARLHPGMPRFEMNQGQISDLIAYLKKLGKETDLDPGLSPEEMKIGASLPMSGNLAEVGQDIKSTLEAYFAEVNSTGGVYGRRLRLVVEDSAGTAKGATQATEQLVEKDDVFALVGSFEVGDDNATNDYLKKEEAPLVGPVTLSPLLSVPPNPFVFYLMPSFGSQARVLVDFVAAIEGKTKRAGPLRVAVVYAKNGYDEDARIGIESQAKTQKLDLVDEQKYEPGSFEPAKLARNSALKNPDYVFFFGPADDIVKFSDAMRDEKVASGLVSSLILLGRFAFELPPEVARKTYLSYPAAYPKQEDMSDFDNLVKKSGLVLRHSAFQRAAYGAGRVFVGALEQAGRRLSRKGLVSSLEDMREFQTGVLPPVTFGPNRRVGCEGSYVVGIDLDKKQIVPLSGWLTPAETFSALSGSSF